MDLNGFGLATRPNTDQTTPMSLPTVTATGLRFFARAIICTPSRRFKYSTRPPQPPSPEPSSALSLTTLFARRRR
jgi:hypothetical protein